MKYYRVHIVEKCEWSDEEFENDAYQDLEITHCTAINGLKIQLVGGLKDP